jgi:hypothetical protein
MTETLITDLSWGSMEVSIGGQKHHFKDCKVWPGGAREWRWGETGTHHSPGIQPADIEEILAQGIDVLVLGCGAFRRLGVCTKTETLLRERGISYHVEKTGKAVQLFNQLTKEDKRVGGVFHSTC